MTALVALISVTITAALSDAEGRADLASMAAVAAAPLGRRALLAVRAGTPSPPAATPRAYLGGGPGDPAVPINLVTLPTDIVAMFGSAT